MANPSKNSTHAQNTTDLVGPQAIILAAGKGTRMGGDVPKVLHRVADQPLVRWVVEACLGAGVSRCVIVVGYKGQDVIAALQDIKACTFVEQKEQRGTGHATRMAQPCFETSTATDVFVLAGDAPLIQTQTLRKLLNTHRQSHAVATLATAILDNPEGYGRVVRDDDGSFEAIVEQKDATDQQKQICEINPSYYCFRSDLLFESLAAVTNANAQNEYYLTDVPGNLKRAGHTVCLVEAVPAQEVLGVNTQQQLDDVDRILRARTATAIDDQIGISEP